MPISEKPFTILAPVNGSATTPESLLFNEELAEEIVANHIILGEEIRPERLLRIEEKRTAGGQPLLFKIDNEG